MEARSATAREEMIRVLFGDPRINILSTLYPTNAIVFLLSLSLQITVAVLDGPGTVMILVLAPILSTVFYIVSAGVQFSARRNNNPSLIVGSAVMSIVSCVWGVIALIGYVALVVVNSFTCSTMNCVGIEVCAVLLCLITAAGFTINLIGSRILAPLVCCNPQLGQSSSLFSADPTSRTTTAPVGTPPTSADAAAGPSAADGHEQNSSTEDDWRGIAAVTSVVNESFAYGRLAEEPVNNP